MDPGIVAEISLRTDRTAANKFSAESTACDGAGPSLPSCNKGVKLSMAMLQVAVFDVL